MHRCASVVSGLAAALALVAGCGPTLDTTTGVAGAGAGAGGGNTGTTRRGGIGGNVAGTLAGNTSSGSTGQSTTGGSTGPASSTEGSSGGTSGGSLGSSTTTAQGSSGSGGATCNAAGTGLAEYGACTTTANCNCPYICNNDGLLARYLCEPTCATSADCVDPRTVCRGGACVFNLCGPSGGGPNGGPNGVASGACDAAGTNDGSCWVDYTPATAAMDQPASVTWLCYQGGGAAAGAACSVSRSPGAAMCTPGSICASADGGVASKCVEQCNPTSATGTCPAGQGCGEQDLADNLAPDWGLCYPVSGGCLTGFTDNELTGCAANASCGCVTGKPLACTTDTTLGINDLGTETYCERSCTATSDCPIVFTACNGKGTCDLNYCGDAGGYSAPCNAAGTGDGTCIPYGNPTGTATLYGLCYQGGSATGDCDSAAQRSDPSELCVAGAYCFNVTGQTQQQCFDLCDPIGADRCPGTDTCQAEDTPQQPLSPDLGVCQ